MPPSSASERGHFCIQFGEIHMGDTAGVKKLKPEKENTGLEIVVIPVLDKNFKLAKSA